METKKSWGEIDEESKMKWLYPKQWGCAHCQGVMERQSGNNFYEYSYKCSKKGCERNKTTLYGNMRNELDWGKETAFVYNTTINSRDKQHYKISLNNGKILNN